MDGWETFKFIFIFNVTLINSLLGVTNPIVIREEFFFIWVFQTRFILNSFSFSFVEVRDTVPREHTVICSLCVLGQTGPNAFLNSALIRRVLVCGTCTKPLLANIFPLCGHILYLF